jgi:hypothetical protein
VNKYATREGKYLGFVLETTEWSRENQTVVIALKLCSVIVSFRMTVLLTKTLV